MKKNTTLIQNTLLLPKQASHLGLFDVKSKEKCHEGYIIRSALS